MSGERVLNHFSEVGSHIDACIEIVKQAKNVDCFPDNGNLLPRLMRIQESIASATQDLDADFSYGASHAALKDQLKGCIERAKSLHNNFMCMDSPTESSEFKNNIKKMRTASKVTRANKLIDEIMKDLQDVSENETFKADKKTYAEALAEDKVNKKRDEKDKGASEAERQINHNGRGNQNVAMGRAAQVNGPVKQGTFTFN